MDVLSSIDLLDNLIVENTKAPATANMRNQLSHVREQVEALQTLHSELKNKHSVLENTSEHQIADLKRQHEELVEKFDELNKESADNRRKAAR